jgi:hypothetical protein
VQGFFFGLTLAHAAGNDGTLDYIPSLVILIDGDRKSLNSHRFTSIRPDLIHCRQGIFPVATQTVYYERNWLSTRTSFLKNAEDFPEMMEVYRRAFTDVCVARSGLITEFLDPQCLIQI